MDRNLSSDYIHSISINERKNISISGIVKLESFDDEEFLFETNMGFLVVKGSALEIVRLDTKEGVISIKGTINSFEYLENLKKANKTSIFEKVFK